MEKKVCTYSEAKHRLQLVRVFVETTNQWIYEIRYNRKVVHRFTCENVLFARLMFARYMDGICIDRTSPFVLKITP